MSRLDCENRNGLILNVKVTSKLMLVFPENKFTLEIILLCLVYYEICFIFSRSYQI